MNETVKKKYMKKEDYIGKKYGLLTVLEFDHYGRKSQAYMKCKCECGNTAIVPIAGLKSGNNKSCGCLHAEVKRNIVRNRKDQTTHGEAHIRLYRIWAHMKSRCNANGKSNGKRYADRGIKVCKEWQEYANFREWALSNGYDDNLSIDRIDVNGNYEPSNCRWASAKQQGRNRENTLYVDYHGEKMTLKDACEIAGIAYQTAYKRIRYHGMNIEKALETTPVHGRKLCYGEGNN